jgi:hypothetical protein
MRGELRTAHIWITPRPPLGVAAAIPGPCVVRSLKGQLRRGLRGVYAAALSGHQESPPVQKIRRNEAPELTANDSTRQAPITRNEGVPGSSPGVGFFRFAGTFFCVGNAERAFRVRNGYIFLTRSPLVKVSSCAAGPCRFAGISTLAAVGSLYPYVPACGRECPRFPAAASECDLGKPFAAIAIRQPLLLLVLVSLREEALLAELLERLVDLLSRLRNLGGVLRGETTRLDGVLEGFGPVT